MVSMVPPSMFDRIVRHAGCQRLRVTVIRAVSLMSLWKTGNKCHDRGKDEEKEKRKLTSLDSTVETFFPFRQHSYRSRHDNNDHIKFQNFKKGRKWANIKQIKDVFFDDRLTSGLALILLRMGRVSIGIVGPKPSWVVLWGGGVRSRR